MPSLLLYAVFHANLNFSRVPNELHPQIIRKSYLPLLDKIEANKVPLGLEMSGYTLETINAIDASFAPRLKRLWDEGLCEFIGCGYIQSIMPLIPYRVNQENLVRGNKVYSQLLGRQPDLAFVNEQVYGKSLPPLYREHGYQGIIVNWDSSDTSLHHPDLAYYPCSIGISGMESIPILWHSQRTSRQFQEFANGHTTQEQFINNLLAEIPSSGERVFPLYTSDWDVFDFKPWECAPDGFIRDSLREIDRIFGMINSLKYISQVSIDTPSNIIAKYQELPQATLQNSELPITYKKQDEHSMGRWAVCGRDSIRMNTQCNQLYQELLALESTTELGVLSQEGKIDIDYLWNELCFLWGSDFRTYTTDDKYFEFRKRIEISLEKVSEITQLIPHTIELSRPNPAINGNVGGSTSHKGKTIDLTRGLIETESVVMNLSPEHGGCITYLKFPKISNEPLVDHISFDEAPDFTQQFSGALEIGDQWGRKINDNQVSDLVHVEDFTHDLESFLIRCRLSTELGVIWKTYRIYYQDSRVDLNWRFQWSDLLPSYFRLGRIYLNTRTLDRTSLFYSTTNGGSQVENFQVSESNVKHDVPMGPTVTSRCCLGATEGWVAYGDDQKGLGLITCLGELYSVPLVNYESSANSFSIVQSLGEQDDTSHILWRGHSEWTLAVLGGSTDLIEKTRALALLINDKNNYQPKG